MTRERAEPSVQRTCEVCGETSTVLLSKADDYYKTWDGARCSKHPKSEAVVTLDETPMR